MTAIGAQATVDQWRVYIVGHGMSQDAGFVPTY